MEEELAFDRKLTENMSPKEGKFLDLVRGRRGVPV